MALQLPMIERRSSAVEPGNFEKDDIAAIQAAVSNFNTLLASSRSAETKWGTSISPSEAAELVRGGTELLQSLKRANQFGSIYRQGHLNRAEVVSVLKTLETILARELPQATRSEPGWLAAKVGFSPTEAWVNSRRPDTASASAQRDGVQRLLAEVRAQISLVNKPST